MLGKPKGPNAFLIIRKSKSDFVLCSFVVVFFISVSVQFAVGFVLVTSLRRMASLSRSRDPNKLTAEKTTRNGNRAFTATVMGVVAIELELLIF